MRPGAWRGGALCFLAMTTSTGRDKIEQLTNQWYAFTAVSAVASVLASGIGFFSILFAACSTAFTFALTWFLGRRLLARSSLTRAVLVLVSLIGGVLGALATARSGWAFLGAWSFAGLLNVGLSGGSVVMNLRSFRTLTDASVKAYVAG